jgi:hypothetical protein
MIKYKIIRNLNFCRGQDSVKGDKYRFTTKDGIDYDWEQAEHDIIKLTKKEINYLRNTIIQLKSDDIEKGDNLRGIPMGVIVSLSEERQKEVLTKIKEVVNEQVKVSFSKHALFRLDERQVEQEEIDKMFKNIIFLKDARLTPIRTKTGLITRNFHPNISFSIYGIIGNKPNDFTIISFVYLNKKELHIVTVINDN